MAMAKIWRNRIEAGTQKLANCPSRYRANVIALIQQDLEDGSFTKDQLKNLVKEEMLTPEEYEEIVGEAYEA